MLTTGKTKVPEKASDVDLLEGAAEEANENTEEHNGKADECTIDLQEIQDRIQVFLSSEELEVQERAGTLFNFIKCYLKIQSKGQSEELDEIALELASAFSSELNPVASKAQKKVPVPEGLDLDAWINDPPSESEDEEEDEFKSSDVFGKNLGGGDYEEKKVYQQPSSEELTQVCCHCNFFLN